MTRRSGLTSTTPLTAGLLLHVLHSQVRRRCLVSQQLLLLLLVRPRAEHVIIIVCSVRNVICLLGRHPHATHPLRGIRSFADAIFAYHRLLAQQAPVGRALLENSSVLADWVVILQLLLLVHLYLIQILLKILVTKCLSPARATAARCHARGV